MESSDIQETSHELSQDEIKKQKQVKQKEKPSTSRAMTQSLDIHTLAMKLSNDPVAVRNWSKIYGALELSPGDAVTFALRYNIGLHQSYDLFTQMLLMWQSEVGNKATEQVLEDVLRSVKEQPEETVGPSTSTSMDQLQLTFPLRHNYRAVVDKYVSRPLLEKEIIEGLSQVKNPNSEIDFPVVVLHGIGGMGKTTLARKICQLADKYFDENSVWTDSEKEELIINSFLSLIGGNDANKEKIQEILKKIYVAQFKSRRCILIFDNAADFKAVSGYLPLNLKTKLSVIITTNNIFETGDYGEVMHIRVDIFSIEEFKEFVGRIIKGISDVEIKILDAYTGRIPYLTNIVCYGLAKWKRLRPNNNINEYLGVNDDKLLKGGKEVDYVVFKRSNEEIVERQMNIIKTYYEDDGITSSKLLCILAYCKSEVVKSELIELAKKHASFESFTDDTIEVAIQILIEQGFIEQNNENLSIHRSYQKAIQNILRNQGLEQAEISQLCDITIDYFTNDCLNYVVLWELAKDIGDSMFEKMTSGAHITMPILSNNLGDARQILQAYVQRTRSKMEYVQWDTLNKLETQKLDKNKSNIWKSRTEDENLPAFLGLIEEYDSFLNGKKGTIRNILATLIFVASQKLEWLDYVVEKFELLHKKLFDSKLSLLHYAAVDGNLLATKYFLEKGVDVNVKDDMGLTPLHHAAIHGNLEVVETLCEGGADINCQDKNLLTPLQRATELNQIETVKFLLSKNADVMLGNIRQTPLCIAIAFKHKEMAELLVKHVEQNLANKKVKLDKV